MEEKLKGEDVSLRKKMDQFGLVDQRLCHGRVASHILVSVCLLEGDPL